MQCSDEQEAQTWSQLLDCIHSMARQLPAGGQEAARRGMGAPWLQA